MKQITFYDNKNITGSLVYQERLKQNISQTELAAKMQVLNINIDQQMISKIEKNQRQVTDYEMIGLCICLNINPNVFINEFKCIDKKQNL